MGQPGRARVSEGAARFIFLWLRALGMNRGRGSGAGMLLPGMIWKPLYISQSFILFLTGSLRGATCPMATLLTGLQNFQVSLV